MCKIRRTVAQLPDVRVEKSSGHKDTLYGKAFISIFRRTMRPYIGWQSKREGYDGLVEECRMLLARKGPEEQAKVVEQLLNKIFLVPHGPKLFRRFFAHRPQMNAALTPVVFEWLVGPSKVNAPEDGGAGVLIEKCRFLEESGCKGLCVNMCQQPVQKLFTEKLGLPLRMTPNYEDMSCQMSFGVHPLPIEEDPAITGDCLSDCKMSGTYKRQSKGGDNCYVDSPNKPKKQALVGDNSKNTFAK